MNKLKSSQLFKHFVSDTIVYSYINKLLKGVFSYCTSKSQKNSEKLFFFNMRFIFMTLFMVQVKIRALISYSDIMTYPTHQITQTVVYLIRSANHQVYEAIGICRARNGSNSFTWLGLAVSQIRLCERRSLELLQAPMLTLKLLLCYTHNVQDTTLMDTDGLSPWLKRQYHENYLNYIMEKLKKQFYEFQILQGFKFCYFKSSTASTTTSL